MEELLTASSIVTVVARHYAVSPNDVFRHAPSNSLVVEDQRHLATLRVSIYLIHQSTQFSLPEIAKILRRHHTTIYYHRKVISQTEIDLADRLRRKHQWPVITLVLSWVDDVQQQLTHSFAERLIPSRSLSASLLLSLRKELGTKFERVDPLSELPDNTPDDTSSGQT